MSELSKEANKVLNYLHSIPQLAKKAVSTKLCREILLYTDGVVFCQGRTWDVKSEELGAGVHRISLELRG